MGVRVRVGARMGVSQSIFPFRPTAPVKLNRVMAGWRAALKDCFIQIPHVVPLAFCRRGAYDV